MCTHGGKDRVEAALGPLGGEVPDPVPRGEPDAESRDPVQLSV
jgi:hypothetical protein